MASVAIQAFSTTASRSPQGFGQTGRGQFAAAKTAPPVSTGHERLVESLTDRIQLSPQAADKLAELQETSKELSATLDQLKQSAQKQEEAARAAKREELKEQIRQLKLQLSFATEKSIKAIVKKLKQLSAQLKQVASDTASAGSGGKSGSSVQSVAETGKQLVQALGGETEAAPSQAAETAPVAINAQGQSAANTTVAGSGAENGKAAAEAGQSDRDRKIAAYRETHAAQQKTADERSQRQEERQAVKKLARDLKDLIREVRNKVKELEPDSERDLKEAGRDLEEGLSTLNKAESRDNAGVVSITASGPTVVADPIASIAANVQAYVNVQVTVSSDVT